MYLIIFLLLAVAAVFGGYYLLIHIIQLFTGCDKNEAALKIQRFFNGTTQTDITTDVQLREKIWTAVENIIGEERFKQLENYSETLIDSKPLLYFEKNSIIPFLSLSVEYKDDNEKRKIESAVCKVIKNYLMMYNYPTIINCEWGFRKDDGIPFLKIDYATTKEQEKSLKKLMENYRIINQDLIDESEDKLYE